MKERAKKRRLDIWSFLIGVVISCALGVGFYARQSSPQELPQLSKDSEADVHVAAMMMRLDYERKPDIADFKYKDKIVYLGGELASFRSESADHPYLLLSSRVKCYFDGSQEAFEKIPIESYVTLKGICTGSIHGNIMLEHCVLLSPTDY